MSDAVNIDALSIEVSTSAKKAAKDFDALSASMKKADQAAGQTAGMRKMQSALEAVKNYEKALDKMRGISSASIFAKGTSAALKDAESLQRKLEAISAKLRGGLKTRSQVSGVQVEIEKAENATARLKARIDEVAGKRYTTPAFEDVRAAVEKQESKLSALYGKRDRMTALGVPPSSNSRRALMLDIRDAEREARRYREEAARLAQTGAASFAGSQTVEYQKLQAALNDATSALARYKQEADSAGKSADKSSEREQITGYISKTLGRISRVLQYKMLSSSLRYITSSMQTGMQNIYSYSKAVNGAYASAMDRAAGASLTFGNSLAAAVSPALVALIPTISTVVGWIRTLSNALAEVFAMLSGRSTFTAATDAATEYKKAAGGAAGANKDLLASFDQLHIIQSSGGGGGGGGGASADLGFEEVDVDADKYKWLADNIDWLKYVALASGAALAGMLPPGLSKAVIGLGTAIVGLVGAYGAFNEQWESGINADNIRSYLFGAAEAAAGLYTLFGKVGLAVGLVVGGIAGIINPLKEFAETGKMSAEAGTQLAIAIGAIGVGLSLLLGGWIPLVIAAIAALWVAIQVHFDEIVAWVDTYVVQPIATFFRDLWDGIGSAAQTVVEAVQTAWTAVSTWFDDNVIKPVAQFFDKLWAGIKSAAQTVVNRIKTIWGSVKAWFDEKVIQPVKKFFADMWDGIKTKADEIVEGVKSAWDTVSAWFNEHVIEPLKTAWESVKSAIQSVVDAVTGFLGMKTDKTVNVHTVYSSETLPDGMKMQEYDASKTLTNPVKPVTPDQVSNAIKSPLNNSPMQIDKSKFDSVYNGASAEQKKMLDNALRTKNITLKAAGGFAQAGEMFIARESGPELVGSIGNKTAVANNDQIVQSVAGGVATANKEQNALLREQNALLRALLEKESTVKLAPSAALGRVNARSAAMYGKLAGAEY